MHHASPSFPFYYLTNERNAERQCDRQVTQVAVAYDFMEVSVPRQGFPVWKRSIMRKNSGSNSSKNASGALPISNVRTSTSIRKPK